MMEAGMTNWQQNLNWLDDDEDQDSDTDSKLSGSAAADSVMRHLARSRPPFKQGGNEFSLGTMREQDEEEVESVEGGMTSDSIQGSRGSPSLNLTNGYHHHPHHESHHPHYSPQLQDPHDMSPQLHRRGDVMATSPKIQQRQRSNYENTQMGGGLHYASRKQEILSPVPETTTGGARVVEISVPPSSQYPPGRKWSFGSSGPGTHSMENITRGTPPSRRRGGRNYDPHIPNGRAHYRDVRIPHSNGIGGSTLHSRSHEHLAQPGLFNDGMGVAYGGEILNDDIRSEVTVPQHYNYRKVTLNNSGLGVPAQPLHPHGHSHSFSAGVAGGGRVPNYRSVTMGAGGGSVPVPTQSSPSHSYSGVAVENLKTPPQRRANYTKYEMPARGDPVLNSISQATSLSHDPSNHSASTSAGRMEPNLQDVVQFLRSGDRTLVSNAASYLQHLAYGDDIMKTKIREHGAIPNLVSLIRHPDTKVQITVLGALKNLSYGRVTDENKHVIASDHNLTEILIALKNSRVSEVRELLTALLWNLSACESLKLKMMKACLHDVVEIVMIPYTMWNMEEAREPTARPQAVSWNVELRNTTGMMRNISSAGEPARSFMRGTNGMVDTLLWLLKAGVQQKSAADEKTVENTVCVLRNLSYRLENEVDPQEGGEDVLDREWEHEQRRDMEEMNRSFSKASPGCMAFCTHSRTKDTAPRVTLSSISRPLCNVDFVYPDASAMPKRRKPVYGKSLLWQPEVAFIYLAITEQYPDCIDALEAAAGAIQNLTACEWKWAVYIRNIIRTSNGLHLLADLLNNGHDAVVRAAATTLRNLATDHRNRATLGVKAIISILPRLPLSTNHLGISEETSVALLCCLMELFSGSPENAKFFHDKNGIPLLTRVARSRQHTAKVTFAAHKACSLLWTYKDCRSALKKVGWDMNQYSRMARDAESQFDFASHGSISRDHQGSRRKKQSSKRSSKKSGKKKDQHAEDVGFIAGGVPTGEAAQLSQQSSSTVQSEHGLLPITSPASTVNSSHQQPQFIVEPNYQSIPTPTSHNTSPAAIIEPNYQSVPPTSSPRHTAVPAPAANPPAIIYQSIQEAESEVPPRQSGVQGSRAGVDSAPSTTTSGPLSVTSQEEDPEPDPNATYASVDIEKKRASRRVREQQKKMEQQQHVHVHHQQQQQEPVGESIDSWV